MRQVDRNDVPRPKGVESVAGLNPNYPDNVRRALRSLYLNKCYLCEVGLSDNGNVDQFHRADERHESRATEWENLHWACHRCRARKLETQFQWLDENDPRSPATLLIDPSSPPLGRSVRDLVKFARGLRAEGVGGFDVEDEVALTADFLNGPPRHDRRTRYEELILDISVRSFADEWQRLSLESKLVPETWPEEQVVAVRDSLRWADRVYRGYLQDNRPFSTSIGQELEEVIGVSVEDFKYLSDAFQRSWRASRVATSPTKSIVERWREKLEFFRQLEPTTTDPDLKFALKKQIEEVEGKIQELSEK